MNYLIQKDTNIPAYIQIYRKLVNDILMNNYPSGSRLPSKRTLAEEAGVSVITVQHAMELLADEGYVEAVERSGYFVIYDNKDFNTFEPALFAENDFKNEESRGQETNAPLANQTLDHFERFPFSVLSKTMRKVILNYGERIIARSPVKGAPELIDEICAYLGRSRGMHILPEQVVIGSGAEYLYGLIAQLLGRDKVFATEDPGYAKIRKVYESFGIKCRMLKLKAEGISSESLGKTDANVLHVTPFHSYPSGITIGISKKHEYLRWAEMRGGMIIEDNYDSELTVSKKPEDSLFSMTKKNNVIYLNTFSKTIAPSMRIGYMILPEPLVKSYDEKLGFYACTVPLFEQYVIAALLRNGDFERHINRVRRQRRRRMAEEPQNQKNGQM